MKPTARSIDRQIDIIQEIIDNASTPLSRSQILEKITIDITEKTLQRRLKKLKEATRIATIGEKSGLKYVSLNITKDIPKDTSKDISIRAPGAEYLTDVTSVFSQQSSIRLESLNVPSFMRPKVSYNSSLIEQYVPNQTRYLSRDTAERLMNLGTRFNKNLAAGTYAKDIAQRLLIDLSFNSSRLEGNTYSMLDTRKLLLVGEAANGKFDEETIMILNHKEAILFMIENAEELSVTPFVIRNLHQLLSQDLLSDSAACGQVRQKEVRITKTSYLPLNAPQQLEELFILLLRKAAKITEPFEQAFFLFIHLSYLQAFEDVNKRTARLGCNLPFIQQNLCPLSFVDVPKDDYVRSLIYFYETGDYLPALDVFIWAYERSCQQYTSVEKSVGHIDSYRIKYRSERKQAIGEIIRNGMTGQQIPSYLEQFCKKHQIAESDKFVSIAMVELGKLHSGAIISIGVTEQMFIAWKEKFDATQ
ncbi:Fic family protein [Vibrio hippocampi]|uniref:Fido domain-containing protein n=1 Tax=Vibrio hippocampi TaxID=654686 RepID=A0ABM8ZGP1_9VIBR|nr:Fic family protein [Vibrio hippocampi]CAH0525098.1 hypothetical protein VHP8226_00764 [Vibrio hippocampi]